MMDFKFSRFPHCYDIPLCSLYVHFFHFLVALSNLSGLTRLYIICHSDCHVQDEKTDVAFASFQDQVNQGTVNFKGDVS